MEFYLPKLNRFIEYKQTVHNSPLDNEVEGATILLVYYDWMKWEGNWYAIKEGEIYTIGEMNEDEFYEYLTTLEKWNGK